MSVCGEIRCAIPIPPSSIIYTSRRCICVCVCVVAIPMDRLAGHSAADQTIDDLLLCTAARDRKKKGMLARECWLSSLNMDRDGQIEHRELANDGLATFCQAKGWLLTSRRSPRAVTPNDIINSQHGATEDKRLDFSVDRADCWSVVVRWSTRHGEPHGADKLKAGEENTHRIVFVATER